MGPARVIVFVASAMATFSEYALQPLFETIAADLSVAPTTVGWTSTCALGGFTLGLVLLVPLGDTASRQRVVVALPIVSAASLVVMASTRQPAVFLAAGAVLGAAGVLPQVLARSLTASSPSTRLVGSAGTALAGALLGITAARASAGILADVFGWRNVFVVTASVDLLCALVLSRAQPAAASGYAMGVRYPALVSDVFGILAESPGLRRRALYGASSFAALSTAWITLPLLFSSPLGQLRASAVGAVGLAGLAGVTATVVGVQLLGRGRSRILGGLALAGLWLAWLPLAAWPTSLVALVVGMALLETGVSAGNVLGQIDVYSGQSDRHGRRNAAYTTCVFTGGALGSAGALAIFSLLGWHASCVYGLMLSTVSSGLLVGGRGRRGRADDSDREART